MFCTYIYLNMSMNLNMNIDVDMDRDMDMDMKIRHTVHTDTDMRILTPTRPWTRTVTNHLWKRRVSQVQGKIDMDKQFQGSLMTPQTPKCIHHQTGGFMERLLVFSSPGSHGSPR
jgi:hypothetical protein